MTQASPVAEAPRHISGRLIAALVGVFLLLVLIYFLAAIFFTLIPPILVRVVDAVSGQPIAGIAVTRRVNIARTDAPTQQQSVTKTTGSNGYALFRPYLYWSPILGLQGYWVDVNEKSTAAEPWRREADLGPGQTNRYMPMSLESRCENCELLWKAPRPAAENLRSLWFATVALIPALDSPDKCSSIANPTVAKQCKELNTYRSAFLHFDSLQDIENNKAICRQLEPQAAKSCLDQLGGYVYWSTEILKDSSPYKPRQMPMLPTRPLEEVLPFDIVGGLKISNRRTCCNNAFTGSVTYSADYGWPDRITVRIAEYLTEDAARQAFSSSDKRWNLDPRSTLSDEIRLGNRITVFRTPHIKSAFGESGEEIVFWRSTNKVITVLIGLPRPTDEEVVTKYLGLYPSSLSQNTSTTTQARILEHR